MAAKPWGGVFDQATDRRVEEFTESISFDRRLYTHDITGSIAHAQMLAATGIISDDECQQIEQTLGAIRAEIEQGSFPFSIELEDIHMHIESALIERIGDVGRKLHTGRSRNDQVSTDLRLWVRESIDRVDECLEILQRAFVSRCDRVRDCILPGYTHMQRAQPVLAPHYWLAYCEKFQRDRHRPCRRATTHQCVEPGRGGLGRKQACRSTATTLPVGWVSMSVSANSLDVSSDRDFARRVRLRADADCRTP